MQQVSGDLYRDYSRAILGAHDFGAKLKAWLHNF